MEPARFPARISGGMPTAALQNTVIVAQQLRVSLSQEGRGAARLIVEGVRSISSRSTKNFGRNRDLDRIQKRETSREGSIGIFLTIAPPDYLNRTR